MKAKLSTQPTQSTQSNEEELIEVTLSNVEIQPREGCMLYTLPYNTPKANTPSGVERARVIHIELPSDCTFPSIIARQTQYAIGTKRLLGALLNRSECYVSFETVTQLNSILNARDVERAGKSFTDGALPLSKLESELAGIIAVWNQIPIASCEDVKSALLARINEVHESRRELVATKIRNL
jgi:hypothetical protein